MLKFLKPKKGFINTLSAGLKRTRKHLGSGLGNLILGKKTIDRALLEDIETQLLLADVGVFATQSIIDQLAERVKRKELANPEALISALKTLLYDILAPCCQPLEIPEAPKPFTILFIGVNGAGKTTTIGKLAWQFKQNNKKLMLAAGDTFRAAAVEQLQVWGQRNDIPVIAQQTGADSASVIYDSLEAAKARDMDILIADTAGRLHSKAHLMEELQKVKRVMAKLDPDAPHEVMLVLDAGTGQNALQQAQMFHEAIGVTGITLTKLDGTAKGGIIFAIANQCHLPIRYIGVGEGLEDLQPFDAKTFINALFEQGDDSP